MGMIYQAKTLVDFKAVSAAALNALDAVIPQPLPGGHRESGEWVARNPHAQRCEAGQLQSQLEERCLV